MPPRFRTDIDGYVDVGFPNIRWDCLYFTYLDTYTKWPLAPTNIGRKSQIYGMQDAPDPMGGDGIYMVVVDGKWTGTRVDQKPPDAEGLDGGMLLSVVGGVWAPVYQPYTLPYAYPEEAWLSVVDGKWGSRLMNLTPLPTVRDSDADMILTVIGGEWGMSAGDNFYLPSPPRVEGMPYTPPSPSIHVQSYQINEDINHTVQAIGNRWMKRPLYPANYATKGLVQTVPGDDGLILHGDNTWRGINGRDTGHWRIGDLRVKGAQADSIWLPCDGSTVGRTGADYSGVDYYDIYIFLGGTVDTWSNDELLTLPTIADHEVLIYDRLPNPVSLIAFTGPVAAGPYYLEASATPSFENIMFSSNSVDDAIRWEDIDGTSACNMQGYVNETYARFAEPVVSAAVMDAGFFFYRWKGADGLWTYAQMWLTEEDIFRLDTILSAGVSTSGVAVRSPAFRHQLLSVNGRAVRGELYKTNTYTTGSVMARNTAALIDDQDERDTAEALQGLEITVYGAGDQVPDMVAGHPDMRELMNQLKDLDGYARGKPPKYTLTKITEYSGKKKWWGAVVGPDMRIYFIPHYAEPILVVDPKTSRISTWGSFGTSKGKWAGAVAAPNGSIYCFPYANSNFLVLQPLRNRGDIRALGAPALRLGTWVGGSLTLDNRIIAPSMFGHQELEIDLETEQCTQTDLYRAMRLIRNKAMPWFTDKDEHPFRWQVPHKNYMDTATLPFNAATSLTRSSQSMFGGCVIGSDGRVRGVPCGIWHVEAASSTGNGSLAREDLEVGLVVPNRELFYWGLTKREWRTQGEPLASNTATMGSTMMRYLDYDWQDRSNRGFPANYQGVKDKQHYEHLIHKRMKYLGGILAPDGNNYFLPCAGDSPEVLVASPSLSPYTDKETALSAFNVSDPRFANCRGGCLGPDGNIYAACADGTAVFIITPRTRQVVTLEINHPKLHRRYTAWMGAVVGPDGWIYFPPFDSEYMLVVDPCVAANPWSAELNQFINKF